MATTSTAAAVATAAARVSNSYSPLLSKQTARIVVIGAGPSGIAAATRLLEAGFRHVVVLEAENRIGGRIHTIPFGDNVIDLGAQWCHGEEGNVIYEMVRNMNVLDSTGDVYYDYQCVRSNREIVPTETANLLKNIAENSIPERQTELVAYEGSLGTYLTEKYWRELEKVSPPVDREIAEEFFENFKKFESSVEAADHLFEVSGSGHLEYWLCEGDLLLNWRDKGFKTFLNILMKTDKDLTDSCVDYFDKVNLIQLNKSIKKIDWQDDKEIRLTCQNGEVLSADHVICTMSLGVLKEQHKEIFTPALPTAKVRAIEGLKLGTVDKFFLEFEKPFGPEDATGFSFLWRDEDLKELRNSASHFWLESVFGFYRVSYQPRLLQGWIIGAHARHMETLTESEVLEGLIWLFNKFFSFPIPNPINFKRTQWYSNPNFRGSYSFRSTYTDELRTGAWDLATPLTNSDDGRPRLQFAGEATHEHYYSTAHGAVESGWREADRLIAYYQPRKSQL